MTPEPTPSPITTSPSSAEPIRPTPPEVPACPAPIRNRLATRLLFLLLPAVVALFLYALTPQQGDNASKVRADEKAKPPDPPRKLTKAPELEGGVAWLNTAGPVRLKDLRGKV